MIEKTILLDIHQKREIYAIELVGGTAMSIKG